MPVGVNMGINSDTSHEDAPPVLSQHSACIRPQRTEDAFPFPSSRGKEASTFPSSFRMDCSLNDSCTGWERLYFQPVSEASLNATRKRNGRAAVGLNIAGAVTFHRFRNTRKALPLTQRSAATQLLLISNNTSRRLMPPGRPRSETG